jgi:hypothetical protein
MSNFEIFRMLTFPLIIIGLILAYVAILAFLYISCQCFYEKFIKKNRT